MLALLRAALRRLLPVPWRLRLLNALRRLREPAARRAFERAAPGAPLGPDRMRALCAAFPVVPVDYGRSADDYLARGEERLRDVARHLSSGARVLEVGGGDGMACYALQRAGYRAVLTDIEIGAVDSRVAAAGVQVARMDATRLGFADASFDAVFSYNAFEHVPDPAATFAEMRRVLRPGGIGFISFAALGCSPYGAHLYHEIGVPWVHLLFAPETIDAWRRDRGFRAAVPWINGWPVDRFRALFASAAPDVETLEYAETRNLHFLSFARRMMPQLKRAPSWDALVVDSMRFVFRLRAHTPPRPRAALGALAASPRRPDARSSER